MRTVPTLGGAKCSKVCRHSAEPNVQKVCRHSAEPNVQKCADIRRSQMFKSVPTFGEAKCLKKGSVPLRKNKPATMMVAGLEVCQSVNAHFFGKMIW